VRFEVANFLDWGGGRAGEFQAVTCLSIVKWVHINWGDAGLRAFLARVADLLAPGGRLVLEPQPWTSYVAAFRKQDMSACEGVHPPQSLKLRPEDIGPELERLGLERVPGGCTPADAAAPGTPANFQRPLLVYQKPLGGGPTGRDKNKV
jgi:7SK snRNA methylphosphate capping enzyme